MVKSISTVSAQLSAFVVIVTLLEALLLSRARADALVFPRQIERHGKLVDGFYHFETPVSGSGTLTIQWTDVYGRVVERDKIALNLKAVSEIPFRLDMRRAVATENELQASLSLDDMSTGGAPTHRNDLERLSFTVRPSKDAWSDYQIIMWQPHSAAQNAALKKLGVTAGTVEKRQLNQLESTREEAPFLLNDMPWYVENIATDFYSPYHRWFPDHPVNWLFLAAEKRHEEHPGDMSAFFRNPGLSDPQWLKRIHDRLVKTVQSQRIYRPLFYNLGDETGIADLSSSWDFDFSDSSLSGMRTWLKEGYHTLPSLNSEWGTNFASWDEVTPATTEATFRRPDQNFAAWSDFKEWMDVAFARAIRMGTDAVHSADPEAFAAIEGGQGPGTGGYDYTRLSSAVDLMEIYDIRNNVEIVHSLNPRLVILSTSFESGLPEQDRVWRELFQGNRGLILWDSKHEFVRADGSVGSRGRAAATYFKELHRGIGALLINSHRRADGVDILYSPVSMRIQWMLDQRARLAAGKHVSISRGSQGDPITSSIGWFTSALEHVGLAPRFVSREMIEQGALRTDASRILVLPYTIALSPAEAIEIREFSQRGGVILADGQPGLFDEHGRQLSKPLLGDLFRGERFTAVASGMPKQGDAIYVDTPMRSTEGAVVHGQAAIRRLIDTLKAAGIEPPFPLRGPGGALVGDVRTYVYDRENVEIVALQRDLGTWLSSSGAESITLELPQHRFVYDLRRRAGLGRLDKLDLMLNQFEPTILAISRTPLPTPTISGAKHIALGQLAEIQVGLSGKSATDLDIIHLEFVEPNGTIMHPYSGNVVLRGGTVSKLLPLALNDPPGKWTIRATDALSGQTAIIDLDVSKSD